MPSAKEILSLCSFLSNQEDKVQNMRKAARQGVRNCFGYVCLPFVQLFAIKEGMIKAAGKHFLGTKEVKRNTDDIRDGLLQVEHPITSPGPQQS
eukprot:431836-Amorphochlora_amoeboformis.AAC.3